MNMAIPIILDTDMGPEDVYKRQEQDALLGDITDLIPEVVLGHLPDIDAIDQHLTGGHIVKTRNQVDEG